MFASQYIRKLFGLLKVVVPATYGFMAASAVMAAIPMDLPNSPLFLTGGAKPNLIMALDGSGSMDMEIMLPTNDGAAWWRGGNVPNGESCEANSIRSFVGCGTDGTKNVPSSGGTNRSGSLLNFNHHFDNTNFNRYNYLFPNGSSTSPNTSDRRADGTPALPPLDEFAWARSPAYNGTYFDPAENYVPWPSSPDFTFSDSPPDEARYEPIKFNYGGESVIDLTRDLASSTAVSPTTACTDLTASYADSWGFQVKTGMVIPAGTCIRRSSGTNWTVVHTDGCTIGVNNGCRIGTGAGSSVTINNNALVNIRYFPATFYSSSSSALAGYNAPQGVGVAPDGSVLYKYEIKPENFSTTDEYDAAIQNFANWFTYYRKRHQALRGGLGAAFTSINNMRVAGFPIHDATSSGPNVTMSDVSVVAEKSQLFRNFYRDWLSQMRPGTPNRIAVANIIRNFERPTLSTNPVQYSCQRNFGMLFTDGFSAQPTSTDGAYAVSNVDGSEGAPYADSAARTLADLVMKAYKSIRATPTGNVQVPAACSDADHDGWLDCNKNLHMNFYSVMLGAKGLLFDSDLPGVDTAGFAYADSAPAGWTETWPIQWPSQSAILDADRHPTAVDDIWHATINGRGLLLNAKNGAQLGAKLSTVLQSITQIEGSAAAAAVNSGSINSDTHLFQVSFNTRDWSGQLRSYRVLSDDPTTLDVNEEGTLSTNPKLATIPAASDRVILTVNSSGQGVPFRWAADASGIGADRQNQVANGDGATIGSQRLNYLRGNQSNELPGGIFRTRTLSTGSSSPLGDIIDSAPVFVGAPAFRYPDSLPESVAASKPYSSFRTARSNRQRMVYVGANDGMLHAFSTNESTGQVQEAFAYVPGAVYGNLHLLSSPSYTHRFYVNGTPAVVDAFFGNDWHTVLVGGLNSGGKGIYALDVTDPANVDEGDADDVVLWEITNSTAGFADLGYTFSRPTIARVRIGTPATGKWVAIFGNGYDSTTNKAVLYIVDIANGALLKSIDVSTTPGTTPNWRNGLSTPAVVDLNGDTAADYIYAGDLYGNMWKFDVRDADPANWDVAYRTTGSPGTPVPLFNAGITKPITVRPQVGPGRYGSGMVVLFGTGKYLESQDRSAVGASTQTFFGIYDANVAAKTAYTAPVLGNLQEQTVVTATTVSGQSVRVTSANDVATSSRGWYMNLPTTGERQVSDPVLRNGRVIFTTLIPSTDPCSFGGSSWLMDLDALSGKRLEFSPFDLNNNAQFDAGDMVTVGGITVPVSGIGNNEILSRPAYVSSSNQQVDYAFTTDTGGDINRNRVNPGPAGVGRQSWRQLR